MKLPGADWAVVDVRKVVDYLLNSAHPDNGGKARFFNGLGFSVADPGQLTAALRTVAVEGAVESREESVHGAKTVVDGSVGSPTGGRSGVRTVWIIDRGEETPRLVTAYPYGGR